MFTLYLAVVLTNGEITRTIGEGVYKTPDQCYSATHWPRDAGDETRTEYKCMKVKGDFVNLKVIETK